MQGYVSECFVSFQGEGAHVGRRHLFVRLAGCNIRCSYCDTPDSLERTATCVLYWPDRQPERLDNPLSHEQLAALIGRWLEVDPFIDTIAVTGGEPLVQAEFLAATLDAAKSRVPVLLETNGMLPKRLTQVLPWIDIVSMDMKLPSNSGERAFWEEHQSFLATAQGKDLYVKILVDQNTADTDVDLALQMVASANPSTAAFLQPITSPVGGSTITAQRLDELYRIARRRHTNLRVVPQTHKMMGIQ